MIAARISTDPEGSISVDTFAGLTSDSREVRPGYLFAALPGTRADGARFVGEAVRRGAVAILAPPGAVSGEDLGGATLIEDSRPRRRFALMAAAFYGRQPRTLVAVTGTNGKSSVVDFTRQIWRRLGRPSASLGTLGAIGDGFSTPVALTTPDPVTLYRTVAQMAAMGLDHMALEASSHGLSQYRLDGLHLTAAAFTSFSRDHLDYHGSLPAYLEAKLRLFRELLPPGAPALINADGSTSDLVVEACRQRRQQVVTYGRKGLWLRLENSEVEHDGQILTVKAFGRNHRVRLPLVGGFQAANALCAAGLAVACGEDADDAIAAIEHLQGVPGRLELVARTPEAAAVFVDYAHTPDALANAIEALRPHTRRRLVLVFGCGGDRDPGKRPIMGAVAAKHADKVVVTDDNPRSEDPAAIRWAILSACPGAQEIGDRATAITAAVSELRAGDVLLLAGKGHEQGQIVGSRTLPFDDAATAREAVRRLAAEQGWT
ncbi:MAG: UDP-N-acetylmuramoyl-L-alanyl-D-glutamate--2,6-diaminopimelate ligase [Alphaproteobacteria bacterium]